MRICSNRKVNKQKHHKQQRKIKTFPKCRGLEVLTTPRKTHLGTGIWNVVTSQRVMNLAGIVTGPQEKAHENFILYQPNISLI